MIGGGRESFSFLLSCFFFFGSVFLVLGGREED